MEQVAILHALALWCQTRNLGREIDPELADLTPAWNPVIFSSVRSPRKTDGMIAVHWGSETVEHHDEKKMFSGSGRAALFERSLTEP
jgi:hypothetical protein